MSDRLPAPHCHRDVAPCLICAEDPALSLWLRAHPVASCTGRRCRSASPLLR